MNPITLTLCEDDARLDFLPHYLGHACVSFETRLFNVAHAYLTNHSGGYWQFHHFSNKGFICLLDGSKAETMFGIALMV